MKLMERIAPPITPRTGNFWSSGADGVLRIAHCQDCAHWHHPPMPICPACRSRKIGFDPVSGKGVVHAYTINRYQWFPGMPPPYVIAEIDLVEQPGLRIVSNVVGCAIEAVVTGMSVTVDFEQADDTWIPVFHP
jgi:uncharacterized OB-fold protein